MLDKTVCQACINAMAGKSVSEGEVAELPPSCLGKSFDIQRQPKFRGWYEKDESFWENEGLVKCRVVPAAAMGIYGDPPRWCLYKCEHKVSEGC